VLTSQGDGCAYAKLNVHRSFVLVFVLFDGDATMTCTQPRRSAVVIIARRRLWAMSHTSFPLPCGGKNYESAQREILPTDDQLLNQIVADEVTRWKSWLAGRHTSTSSTPRAFCENSLCQRQRLRQRFYNDLAHKSYAKSNGKVVEHGKVPELMGFPS